MLIDLNGKKGLILGVANEHSIAWGAAKQLHNCGATLGITYGQEKTAKYTKPLADQINCPIYMPCNVEVEEDLIKLFEEIRLKWGKLDFLFHSIAFAPKESLQGRVVDCSLAGFNKAMEVSCYSLIKLAKLAEPLMQAGGSILTVSYYGSQKVVKNYNLMGIVKSALESTVRYLAYELGGKDIRVNALSPGPIMTRAASGIADFNELLTDAVNRSPLKRGVTLDSIGNMAAFMSSDLSKDLTGQVIYIDTGSSIMS